MELIPKVIVCGVSVPPPVAGPGFPEAPNQRTFTSIWAEVTSTYEYQGLQFSAAGDGAQFVGRNPDDGVVIQPPLVQVRDRIDITVEQSAKKVQSIIRTVARHLQAQQSYNLGIRLIWHAPSPNGDAVRLLTTDVLKQSDGRLDRLRAGGELRMGLKFSILQPEYFYNVSVEPWNVDVSMLYIEIDAQYPGVASLETISGKALEVEQYVKGVLLGYLESSSS